MKNYILITFLTIMMVGVTSAYAQDSKAKTKDFHCYSAWKKDWKVDKKNFKEHKKMWQDRPWAAARKHRKACKKAWKSERNEWEHEHGYNRHGYFWY